MSGDEVVQAPNEFPMTLTEWSKLHRLCQVAGSKLKTVSTDETTARNRYEDGSQPLKFSFSPPIPATITGEERKHHIVYAVLSTEGLHLTITSDPKRGTDLYKRVRISAVTHVEQTL